MANTPRFCPRCGLPVEEEARVCDGCGHKLPAVRSAAQEPATSPLKGKMDWKPFLIGFAVLAVIGVIFAISVVGVIVYRVGGRLPLLPAFQTQTPPAVVTPLTASVTPVDSNQPTGPIPTVPPAARSSETPAQFAGPAPNLVYGSIRLFYDPAIASGTNAQTLPANPPGDQTAPWDVAPEHVQVDFLGYALPDRFHNPRLYVYPAEEYAQTSDQAAKMIAGLRQMLQDQPQSVDQVPFLPYWNAGQIMHARMAYLNFHGGSGVRCLTQYAQAVFPINNHELIYTFQGLTADGKTYVAFVLPVSSPSLPASGDLSQAEYEALSKDYSAYLQGVVATLEAQSPETFTPDLAQLDAMIETLEVK